jgi:alpha-mannosidase
LLKASKFPNYEADMGNHHNFIYSILPHERQLEESNVFEEAHKLNNKLWVAIVKKPED